MNKSVLNGKSGEEPVPDETSENTSPKSNSGDLIARINATAARVKEDARVKRYEDAQLKIWPEAERRLPNEFFRSALFNARNRKQPRENMKQAAIAIIGDGRITYTGEELRQDDETVWLQLIHLARMQPLGSVIEFTPYSFCKQIKWSLNGQSYDRLRNVLTRLQATALSVYSKRLGEGVSLSMVPYFAWKDEETGESLPRWRIRVAPELIDLFGDNYYTRLQWEQRLTLPVGLATWMHGYFASHREPHPVKLETVKRGAGLTDDTKSDLRKTIDRALRDLVKSGFLASYEIDDDLVKVVRSTMNY